MTRTKTIIAEMVLESAEDAGEMFYADAAACALASLDAGEEPDSHDWAMTMEIYENVVCSGEEEQGE